MRAESACARARAKRDLLLEHIAELEEMLADPGAMDREQVAVIETRLMQRIMELDRFERDIARPAEETRRTMLSRLANIMGEIEIEPSRLN